MSETINKKSETEIEIVTVIPEQVIPEQVITKVISLVDLKAQLQELNTKLEETQKFKDTPLAELSKIDNDIAKILEEIAKIEALIAEAEAKGVVEKVPETPVEETPIEVLPINEEIIIK